MSLLRSLRPSAAHNVWTDPSAWQGFVMGAGSPSSAGERITPGTISTLAAGHACIDVVSSDIAKIPFKLRQTVGRGSVAVKDNRVQVLIHEEPNPETTPIVFWKTLVADRLGWGAGYGEIIRTRGDEADSLWNIHPSRVRRRRDKDGTLWFEVLRDNHDRDRVEAADMIEIRAPRGVSVVRVGAESFGRALAEDRFSASWLGQAISPSALLTTPDDKTKEQRDNIRADWNEHMAGASSAGKMAVLDGAWTFQPLAMSPSDGELLASRQYSVEEVCRWFRVPPEKVYRNMNTAGWAARENINIAYVTDSLMPHYVEIEQEVGRKLLTPAERSDGLFVRFVVQGLLRGDMKTRVTYYRMMQMMGALSPNDIAELEDRNGMGPAGDVKLLPLNLAPVADVANGDARNRNAADSDSADRGGPGGPANEDPNARLLPGFRDAASRFITIYADRLDRLAKKHGDDEAAFDAALAETNAGVLEAFVKTFTPMVQMLGHKDPEEATRIAGMAFVSRGAAVARKLERATLREEYPTRLALAVMGSATVFAQMADAEEKPNGEDA